MQNAHLNRKTERELLFEEAVTPPHTKRLPSVGIKGKKYVYAKQKAEDCGIRSFKRKFLL